MVRQIQWWPSWAFVALRVQSLRPDGLLLQALEARDLMALTSLIRGSLWLVTPSSLLLAATMNSQPLSAVSSRRRQWQVAARDASWSLPGTVWGSDAGPSVVCMVEV